MRPGDNEAGEQKASPRRPRGKAIRHRPDGISEKEAKKLLNQCGTCYWAFDCPERSRGVACVKYKGPLRDGNPDKGANKNTQIHSKSKKEKSQGVKLK